MASTTTARWSAPRSIGACSTPSAAWSPTRLRWPRSYRALRRARERSGASFARPCRPRCATQSICAPRSPSLKRLAPEAGEETALADRRQFLMRAEKVAGDLNEAHEIVARQQFADPRAGRARASAGAEVGGGARPLGRDGHRPRRGARQSRRSSSRARSRHARHGIRRRRAGAHGGAALRAARRGAQASRAGR